VFAESSSAPDPHNSFFNVHLFVFSSCVFYFKVVHYTIENVDFVEGQLKVLAFMCMSPLPDGRAVEGVGLQALACWHCRFESRPGHGCQSLV